MPKYRDYRRYGHGPLTAATLEEQRNLSFFLGEAYDIYNARFR